AYHGAFGAILIWLETLAVAAAVVLSVLKNQRLRRIGHGVLVGWAALWMLGAIRLSALDPGFWTIQSVFMTGMFACTVYRAVRGWWRVPSVPAILTDAVIESPHTDVADVSPSLLQRSAVRPSTTLHELDFGQGSRSRSMLPPEITAPTRRMLGIA